MTINTKHLVKLGIRCPIYCWLLIVLSLFAPTVAANTAALSWLDAQVQAGGSYEQPNDIATPSQATAETLRARYALAPNGYSASPATLAFLDASTDQAVTEYLARALVAHIEAGTTASNILSALVNNQNPDGGFGGAPGFASTPLDTAYALEALSVAKFDNKTLIGKALAYLQNQQRSDGGFGLDAVNDNSIYITAYAAIAFSRFYIEFQVAANLDKAVNYLFAKRTTAGGWGGSFETAVALLAAVPTSADPSRYITAVDTLRASQQQDGSWEGDTYITALAARALYMASKVKPPTNPTTGVFTGRITDSASGLPLSGVQVSLGANGTVQVLSDVNGRYILENVVPGTHALHYQADGYELLTKTVSVVAGQQADLGTSVLDALPSVGFVAGQVTDVNTGLPIANAQIEMTGASTASIVTEIDGSFRIASAPGTISISASATGYETVSGTGTVVVGGTLSFSPALRKVGTPPPSDPTIKIVGRVVSAAVNGAPLAGVSIQVSGSGSGTATSDADGYFTLSGITAGQLKIAVSAANYQSLEYSALAPESSTLDLGIVLLTPQPTAGFITGGITASDSGLPLANASIQVSGTTPVSATTAADGTYHMTVMPGQVTVSASAPGYDSVSGTGTLVAGSTLIFSPALKPTGTPPGNTGVTLIGKVIDKDTDSPMDQADIVILGTQLRTVSGAGGNFRIEGIAPGELIVEISKEGYQIQQFKGVAPEGSTIDIGTVSMSRLLEGLITISGTVTDNDSTQPIAGAEISVEETGQSAITDQNGHYEIKNIGRLTFSLFTRTPGYLSALKMMSFSEPGTGHADIKLSRFLVDGIKIDSVTTDKSDYEAYQSVPIAVDISNAEAVANRVQLMVEVINPLGQTVHRSPLGTGGVATAGADPVTLLPGESKRLTTDWFTATRPVGWYTVIARAFDPFTGQIVSELSTLVHIVPSQHIDMLRISASPRFTRVGAQEQVDLTATVQNHSNIETEFRLSYSVFDPKLKSVKQGEVTVTIAPEETSKTFTLAQFAHVFDQSGTYAIGIEVLDGPTPVALNIDTITVAPSIRMEASQGITPSTVTPDKDQRVKIKIQLNGVQQQ